MSCTHDCGCTPEIRDARTDEWVQIAPESARPATLTPEQPVKAPGQDGDLFLTRGKPVEVEWPSGNRRLRYVDEGGYRITAGEVGDGAPCPWHEARIVRVLTEDKHAQEPVLPRQIEPEDVRVGMVVECRDLVRVTAVHSGIIEADRWSEYRHPRGQEFRADAESETCERQWWLVEDAPAPVDPDAELVEAMAKEVHDRNCSDVGCRDWDGHGESTRKAWRDDARVVLRNLRAQGFDVTARAEQ